MTTLASRTGQATRECSPPPRTGTPPRTTRGYAQGKEDYLTRPRKIEGQVRGLQKMIEAGTWCPDVVTQVASATRALQEVAVGLLSDPKKNLPPGRSTQAVSARAARQSSTWWMMPNSNTAS